MGVGKTTIGEYLSVQHNINFFDTDKEIQKTTNYSISEYFEKYGEKNFSSFCDRLSVHLPLTEIPPMRYRVTFQYGLNESILEKLRSFLSYYPGKVTTPFF